jgi:selenocysteine lyase/cysteine desulfurase
MADCRSRYAAGCCFNRGTYLNAAYTHPMSLGNAGAVRSFLDMRKVNGLGKGADMAADRSESRALFARLINADPEELAWIPSTMVGENLVVSGLGLNLLLKIGVENIQHYRQPMLHRSISSSMKTGFGFHLRFITIWTISKSFCGH